MCEESTERQRDRSHQDVTRNRHESTASHVSTARVHVVSVDVCNGTSGQSTIEARANTKAGLDIQFVGGSKLLLSSRPGSKTNFVVAKLYVRCY